MYFLQQPVDLLLVDPVGFWSYLHMHYSAVPPFDVGKLIAVPGVHQYVLGVLHKNGDGVRFL